MASPGRPRSFKQNLVIFIVAILLIAGVQKLINYRSKQLRAFVERGLSVSAKVSRISNKNNSNVVSFEYQIAGKTYHGSSEVHGAKFNEGDIVPAWYIAENPNDARIVPLDVKSERADLSSLRKLQWLIAAIFGIIAISRYGGVKKFPIEHVGYLMALVFLIMFIITNYDEKVRVLLVKAFGPRPFHLPVSDAATIFDLVFIAPALFVLMPALLVINKDLLDQGQHIGKLNLIKSILSGKNLSEDSQPARVNVLASGTYLLAMIVAWLYYVTTLHL